MKTDRSLPRRVFLKQTGMLLGAYQAACSGQPATAPAASESLGFQQPLAVQLYTLRNQIQTDPESALKAVSEIGYTQVEVLSQTLPGIAPILKQHGLQPVSGHFPLPVLTGDFTHWGGPQVAAGLENWEQAVVLALEHGLEQMVIAYVQAGERTSIDFYRRLADRMNEAGRQCREAGLRLAYHHHAFEFEPLEEQVPFGVLADGFDPDLVAWQLDTFWLGVCGLDPVEMIRRIGDRVSSLHLKDVADDAPEEFQERNVGPESYKEVGAGRLDFRAILAAADQVGVEYYIVEQDHTPGDPIHSLRQSYRYLKG